jgi:para-aminobenzoate synthetase component 1
MNYCTLFTAKFQNLHAATLFSKLSNKAKAPFSAYINTTKHAIVSASPERFIKKNGNRLTSQPIKGTAKRGKTNQSDLQIAQELVNNPKERAENIMIVDLVRNDLAKIADKKSVNVSELCGLYSFPTVHQLISTVTCQISNQINFKMMIEALFPMGSMTGAPKFSAMNIIEQTEEFRRGIYSGSIGYIEPNGNYDFNVIIRSLIVDKKKQSISAAVGGAITILSNPEDEYQETILKLNVLEEVLC